MDSYAHARISCLFYHFRHFALFFNLIYNFDVNFANLSLTRNNLIVNECRQISSFRYMKVSDLKMLVTCMSENKQLQTQWGKQ